MYVRAFSALTSGSTVILEHGGVNYSTSNAFCSAGGQYTHWGSHVRKFGVSVGCGMTLRNKINQFNLNYTTQYMNNK